MRNSASLYRIENLNGGSLLKNKHVEKISWQKKMK